jgi:hypothetical protein
LAWKLKDRIRFFTDQHTQKKMLPLLLVHKAGIVLLCLLSSVSSGQDYSFYQPSGMNALLMVCVADIDLLLISLGILCTIFVVVWTQILFL